MKKIFRFIYNHELTVNLSVFVLSLYLIIINYGNYSLINSIPVVFNWLSIFGIIDYMARKSGQGSLMPYIKSKRGLVRIVLAAYLMNLISDITGSWLTRSWYYPNFAPEFYLTVFSPIGYMVYGSLLYISYKFIKQKLDDRIDGGRPSALRQKIYLLLINSYIFVGIFGVAVSLIYLFNHMIVNDIVWYQINVDSMAEVNILYFFIISFSIFFILEFISHKLGRNTFTRSIFQNNPMPALSILIASLVCIILVELINSPFQIWKFSNWPLQEFSLFSIPFLAYLIWPVQFLTLIPIINILDSKNTENVW